MIPTSSRMLGCFKSTKQTCLLILLGAKDSLRLFIFSCSSLTMCCLQRPQTKIQDLPCCKETAYILWNFLNHSRTKHINIAKGRVMPGYYKYYVISANTLPFSIHSTHIRWLLARGYWENDGKSLGVQNHPCKYREYWLRKNNQKVQWP